jgi:DNA (cytosine-5)-methyltransferase 1
MPTPVARDSKGRMLNSRQGGDSLPDAALNLLPTLNRNGHGKSLEIEARRLLPTPRATDGTKGGPNQAGSSGDLMLPSAVQPDRFGPYAAAIARWSQVLGRPAPPPTEPGKGGRPQLSPRFVEHMMGLPDGWVTDVDIPRSAQLKALGNGVVPQQAALALAMLDGVW